MLDYDALHDVLFRDSPGPQAIQDQIDEFVSQETLVEFFEDNALTAIELGSSPFQLLQGGFYLGWLFRRYCENGND